MTPRCFIIRHGETSWSLNGRHTGSTDLPLTENGEKRIKATGKALVGNDRLIVPRKLVHVYVHNPHSTPTLYTITGGGCRLMIDVWWWCRYVSPRARAQRTLELLEIGCKERLPWNEARKSEDEEPIRTEAKVEVTEAVREWDYGEYEGLTSKQIREMRREKGEGEWEIWRDGCPGGEYVIPSISLRLCMVSWMMVLLLMVVCDVLYWIAKLTDDGALDPPKT